MEKKKYPSTMYLPWTTGIESIIDKGQILWNASDIFKEQEVVISEKMDGENATIAKEYYHARSLDSRHHPSRDWIKSFHAEISQDIPSNMKICGENMRAKHTISYKNLSSFFLGFSMWEKDFCLSWDNTMEWFDLIGITSVPIIYEGIYNEKIIKGLMTNKTAYRDNKEGYVVRLRKGFYRSEFEKSIAKWVRENFVQTDVHWMHQQIVYNELEKF